MARPLRILAHVHGYPPMHNAGAERMLHVILRWLVERGHEARVILGPWAEPFDLDGVQVLPAGPRLEGPAFFAWAGKHARWADLVLTHLDCTVDAAGLARVNARPIVHLVHNEGQLRHHRIAQANLVIFNSAWVAEAVGWKGGPSVIVRPPVFASDYRVERAGADGITLISTIKIKGVETFFALAEAMPERHFIGVRGAYSLNLDTEAANVEMVPNGPNIRAVYARTRILLVPSVYESWSRCAIEAACSGIPVIASPTPGLRESLGDAGIFVEPGDVDGWRRAIEALDDPETYAAASALCSERAGVLERASILELEGLEGALLKIGRASHADV